MLFRSVEAFRLFYDKYSDPESLSSEDITAQLDDWNNKYAKAKVKDGEYMGFQLNPKFLDSKDKGSSKKASKSDKKESKKKDDKKEVRYEWCR